jgi:hypothetical protein
MRLWVELDGRVMFSAVGDLHTIRKELVQYLYLDGYLTGPGSAMTWFDECSQVIRKRSTVFHGMTTHWEYKMKSGHLVHLSY